MNKKLEKFIDFQDLLIEKLKNHDFASELSLINIFNKA